MSEFSFKSLNLPIKNVLKAGLLSSIFFIGTGLNENISFAQDETLDTTVPTIVTPASTESAISSPAEEVPISLFPEEDDEVFKEEQEIAENENVAPEKTPTNEALPGLVSEENLSSIDPATAGVLNDQSGGLGFDMWADTNRDDMKRLLATMPTRINSQTLQSLARRILLTSADIPPLGDNSEIDLITDGVEILKLRINQLMRLGHADTARQMILESGFSEEQLQLFAETLLEISLLEHDYNQTCSLVYSQTDRLGEAFWQKHLIFCQLLEKNIDGAEFGATLLQDFGEDDPLFYALIDYMVTGGAQKPVPQEPTVSETGNAESEAIVSTLENEAELSLPVEAHPNALHLAMYQVAGIALPDYLLSAETEPRLLKAIVGNPKTNIQTRLDAAEQALQLGLISGETLAALYNAQPFTLEELQAPMSLAEEDYSSRTRALLFQASESDPVPETRIILISKALELSKKAGLYQMTLSAFAPAIAKMPISADLWEFSGTAARALYGLGRPKPAEAWISHLSDQALRNPEAETELLRLWALSRLASSNENMVIEEEAGRKAWTFYVESSVPDESEVEYLRRLTMTYGLLEVLERPVVSQNAWAEMATYEGNLILLSPNPAHLRMMNEAAYSGRRAEVVAWSLRLLGQVSMGRISPYLLADVITALRLVGLKNDAQALALETALANGL